MPTLWQRYQEGIPSYLARHYWWAYLAPTGIKFFRQPLIINAILYGQYRNILAALLSRLASRPCGRTLQLACAYGKLSPELGKLVPELHINDVASVQLEATRNNLAAQQQHAYLARMNAESMGYANASFDTVVIFFLLHELPESSRVETLREVLRILKPGGRILLVDYSNKQHGHLLHGWAWSRLLETLEPFLHTYWRTNLPALLEEMAHHSSRPLKHAGATMLFRNFYRIDEFHG